MKQYFIILSSNECFRKIIFGENTLKFAICGDKIINQGS